MRDPEGKKAAASAQYYEAIAPLIAELRASGFDVPPLEFLALSESFKRAVPILLKWLPNIEDVRVKWSIVGVLSSPKVGQEAVAPLLSEFCSASEGQNAGLKWSIGSALERFVNDERFDQIVEIVKEKRHGIARQMLVAGMGKVRDPRAVDVLIALLKDDDVVRHALTALKKLKARQAKPYIEPLLKHPNRWVRKQAMQTLDRFEK